VCVCACAVDLSQYALPGGARSSEHLELAPRDSAPAAHDRSPAVDPRVLGRGFSPADGPLDAATGLRVASWVAKRVLWGWNPGPPSC
jgi:hypothetical protein